MSLNNVTMSCTTTITTNQEKLDSGSKCCNNKSSDQDVIKITCTISEGSKLKNNTSHVDEELLVCSEALGSLNLEERKSDTEKNVLEDTTLNEQDSGISLHFDSSQSKEFEDESFSEKNEIENEESELLSDTRPSLHYSIPDALLTRSSSPSPVYPRSPSPIHTRSPSPIYTSSPPLVHTRSVSPVQADHSFSSWPLGSYPDVYFGNDFPSSRSFSSGYQSGSSSSRSSAYSGSRNPRTSSSNFYGGYYDSPEPPTYCVGGRHHSGTLNAQLQSTHSINLGRIKGDCSSCGRQKSTFVSRRK